MPNKSRKPKRQHVSKRRTHKRRQTKHRTHKRRQTKRKEHPKDVVVVGKIYANWCGHCKALKPEWKLLKHQIKHRRSDPKTNYVIYAIEQKQQQSEIDRINNTYLRNSSEKLEVNGGYPTIFMIRNGVLSYYQGNRTHLEMLKWYTGGGDQAIV